MTKQAAELRYAVRPRVLFRYCGQLCLVLAVLTVVPLIVSVISGETAFSLRYGIVIAALVAFGASSWRVRAPSSVQTNEGLLVVALMFSITPLVMSFPMMASGLGFDDALFEAISAVTTTGLSAKSTLADAPATFLFARAWMQWYGGLGIVFFSLALMMRPGSEAKSLAVGEAEAEDLVGGTRAHARRVIVIYGVMTAVGIGGCLIVGMGLLEALEYAFSAVSTGGFAPTDAGLAGQGWPAQVWVTVLCLAGAVPLTFYDRRRAKGARTAVDALQVQALAVACLVATLALAASMWLVSGVDRAQVLHHAPLLAVSAQSTAGFSSTSCADLDAGSKLILMFSMLIGGGLGSTAGGLKLLRLLIVASVLRLILLRTCVPQHAAITTRLGRRKLDDQVIAAALVMVVLFVVVVALSWLPFVAMGYSPLDSLFEVVSATGTVGLSAGVTSPTLPPSLKGILCLDMLLGRLEIVAWLVIFYPSTWLERRTEER